MKPINCRPFTRKSRGTPELPEPLPQRGRSSRIALPRGLILMAALGLCLSGAAIRVGKAQVEADPTAIEAVQAVIRAYNNHNLEGFLGLHTDSMTTVAPAAPPIYGLQALREALPREWKAFPDARLEVKRIISDEYQVAAEVIWTGTYKNTLEGLPEAQGQKIRLPQMGIYTVRDGRVTSLRSYFNPDELARQFLAKKRPAPATLSGVPISKSEISPQDNDAAAARPAPRARPRATPNRARSNRRTVQPRRRTVQPRRRTIQPRRRAPVRRRTYRAPVRRSSAVPQKAPLAGTQVLWQ